MHHFVRFCLQPHCQGKTTDELIEEAVAGIAVSAVAAAAAHAADNSDDDEDEQDEEEGKAGGDGDGWSLGGSSPQDEYFKGMGLVLFMRPAPKASLVDEDDGDNGRGGRGDGSKSRRGGGGGSSGPGGNKSSSSISRSGNHHSKAAMMMEGDPDFEERQAALEELREDRRVALEVS